MQNNNLFNDISFWINLVVGIVSAVAVYFLKSIKKDIKELFQRTEKNGTNIATTKTDLKNHRDECRDKHSTR